jgi:hypothetical protein
LSTSRSSDRENFAQILTVFSAIVETVFVLADRLKIVTGFLTVAFRADPHCHAVLRSFAMPHSKVSSSSRSSRWSRRTVNTGRAVGAWRYEPARPAPFLAPPRRSPLGAWAAAALVLCMLGTASLVMAKTEVELQKPSLAAGDRHKCHTLIEKTLIATNQIDFQLRAAAALQLGCLEFRDGSLAAHHDALFGHITQVVKVGIDQQ